MQKQCRYAAKLNVESKVWGFGKVKTIGSRNAFELRHLQGKLHGSLHPDHSHLTRLLPSRERAVDDSRHTIFIMCDQPPNIYDEIHDIPTYSNLQCNPQCSGGEPLNLIHPQLKKNIKLCMYWWSTLVNNWHMRSTGTNFNNPFQVTKKCWECLDFIVYRCLSRTRNTNTNSVPSTTQKLFAVYTHAFHAREKHNQSLSACYAHTWNQQCYGRPLSWGSGHFTCLRSIWNIWAFHDGLG